MILTNKKYLLFSDDFGRSFALKVPDAGFFQDPSGCSKSSGSPGSGPGSATMEYYLEKQNLIL